MDDRKTVERSRGRRKSTDLAERAKELGCLMTISRMLADRRASLPDVLARVTAEIPSAWQFPDLACARLTWHDREWCSPGFQETPWTIVSVIRGRTGAVGRVEVAYRARPVPEPEPPFLPEEVLLLKAVAERVGDVVELQETDRALELYQDRLRSLAAQLATTEERERRDLSTYLHDRIGQGLALVKLKLESVRGCAREDEPNRIIDSVCVLAADLLAETRALTFEISPPILHELGLVPALEWLADHVRAQAGLSVAVDAEPVILPVPDDVRSLVFRSVQELLNNVVRHARAGSAQVRLRTDDSFLRVEVVDDGAGFLPLGRGGRTPPGFGLFSIRERLACTGGRLEIDSAPGRGTRAMLSVPLGAVLGDPAAPSGGRRKRRSAT